MLAVRGARQRAAARVHAGAIRAAATARYDHHCDRPARHPASGTTTATIDLSARGMPRAAGRKSHLQTHSRFGPALTTLLRRLIGETGEARETEKQLSLWLKGWGLAVTPTGRVRPGHAPSMMRGSRAIGHGDNSQQTPPPQLEQFKRKKVCWRQAQQRRTQEWFNPASHVFYLMDAQQYTVVVEMEDNAFVLDFG